MRAILAAIAFTTLAGPALAKPTTPAKGPAKKPVEKAQRVDIGKLAVGSLESLDKVDVASAADAPAPALEAVVAIDKPKADKAAEGDEVKKLDLGLDYGLKSRHAALPSVHVEEFEAKPLTENQVGAIVRERSEDLEYCWLRLPPSKRVVSAAILHLEIEASGKVAAVEVNGDLPAGVGKCITQMATRWAFPTADAPSRIDHGIMLTTASQKIR